MVGHAEAAEGGKTVVLGAARKAEVRFCGKAAAVGGLHLEAIDLRSVAAINGLGRCWQGADEGLIAAVYFEGCWAEIALLEGGHLVSLESVDTGDANAGAGSCADADGSAGGSAMISELLRVFNTMRLTGSDGLPERVYLGGTLGNDGNAEQDAEMVAALAAGLAGEVGGGSDGLCGQFWIACDVGGGCGFFGGVFAGVGSGVGGARTGRDQF